MGKKLPLDSTPRKICILRLSALGDVTHVIALIRQIQNQWPECEITWVCGVFEYKFLRLIHGVRFILFDKKGGLKSYRKLKHDLRHDTFDILLHMQVAARANLASVMIKAGIRLGWDKNRSRDLHSLFINHSVPDALMQHQQDGFLSFGTEMGLQPATPEWNLPITENAVSFADQNVHNDKPLLVISACSSHQLRNWSVERYAAVADYAIQTHGMQVILSGGPSDIEIETADSIMGKMKENALNLVGKDTLEQLVGLLDRADIVLSPDSGPAHLANAVGTKVIGLYACTWSRRSGPYNSLACCVDKFAEAATLRFSKTAEELYWGTKIEYPGIMDLISVDEVCAAVDKIIASD
ncbi:hypothetical protein AB833_01105 [Chromatiales bacterium (ex Bugula neritina AB1)]|nr:hypothetical protein AB833_01105 [Chromatiales bacterium (ex Bugula neritina AB1)]